MTRFWAAPPGAITARGAAFLLSPFVVPPPADSGAKSSLGAEQSGHTLALALFAFKNVVEWFGQQRIKPRAQYALARIALASLPMYPVQVVIFAVLALLLGALLLSLLA